MMLHVTVTACALRHVKAAADPGPRVARLHPPAVFRDDQKTDDPVELQDRIGDPFIPEVLEQEKIIRPKEWLGGAMLVSMAKMRELHPKPEKPHCCQDDDDAIDLWDDDFDLEYIKKKLKGKFQNLTGIPHKNNENKLRPVEDNDNPKDIVYFQPYTCCSAGNAVYNLKRDPVIKKLLFGHRQAGKIKAHIKHGQQAYQMSCHACIRNRLLFFVNEAIKDRTVKGRVLNGLCCDLFHECKYQFTEEELEIIFVPGTPEYNLYKIARARCFQETYGATCKKCEYKLCPSDMTVSYKNGRNVLTCPSPKCGNQWPRNVPPAGPKCPGCKVPVYKSEGCNHMRCTNCWAEWCWACGKIMKDGPQWHWNDRNPDKCKVAGQFTEV